MSQETPRVHVNFKIREGKTFYEGGVRPFNMETNKKMKMNMVK